MPPEAPAAHQMLESFWEYRENFRARMGGRDRAALAEDSEAYEISAPITPLNERLIQAIWKNQLFAPHGLRLLDGRSLRVIDPGRWNGSGGPDFLGARLLIDSEEKTGDVEIHLEASMWRAHRHESDLDYNGVILHAVYRSDDGQSADRLHNGESLPRLEIEPYLFPDLETIRRSMTPDDYPYERPASLGRCYELMTGLEPSVAIDFLERAGEERFKTKVARLEEQSAGADRDQVFYQALMTSLGAGSAKTLYYLLAKRATLRELINYAGELRSEDRKRGLESILLHVGGLVPDPEALTEAPIESREHAAALAELWARFEPYWIDRVMSPTRRWYQSIRPVNFPARRLAAVAELVDRAMSGRRSMLTDLADRVRAAADALAEARVTRRIHPVIRDLIATFEIRPAKRFWETHYSFTAKPAARPMVLVGSLTARSLVFNAVLPALALVARAEKDDRLHGAVEKLHAIFPPLQPNHVTQFMAHRLFGEGGAKELIKTERRQQGLFQVFYACCSGEEHDCDSCYYFKSG